MGWGSRGFSRNMTMLPRLPVEESAAEPPSGASRSSEGEVDVELLRGLCARGYGHKRIAGGYTRETGEYVRHITVGARLIDVETPAGILEYNCGQIGMNMTEGKH